MSRADRTTVIQGWVDRLHAGDDSARAALLDSACERLRRLARKMLRGYPGVARWEQEDDVLQNALIRLDRALRAVTPPTARDFFRSTFHYGRDIIRDGRAVLDPANVYVQYHTTEGPGAGWYGYLLVASEADVGPGGDVHAQAVGRV